MSTDTPHRGRPAARTVAAASLLFLALLATACSASPHSASDAGGSASSLAARDEPRSAVGTTADTAPARAEHAVEPMARAVVSTGQVTLRSRKVATARDEVVHLVAGWGGSVADEQTRTDRHGRMTTSTLTLRVPSARFDAAMHALAGVAEVQRQSRSSQDVTTQVIDNQARVRAAERSLRSVERLLDRATRLSDVIAIESDLARRQADLDSLEQQQAWLSDQTSLSTITVSLGRVLPPPASTAETRGFPAGLARGWTALRAATVGILTVVGAVLPVGVVLLTVAGPAWLVVRRRRGVATGPPADA